MDKAALPVWLLFALVAGMTAIPALADTPPPLTQYNSGVPMHEIQCRDSRVLVETPRGVPVCLYEKSAEALQQRGWVLVQATQDDPADNTLVEKPPGKPSSLYNQAKFYSDTWNEQPKISDEGFSSPQSSPQPQGLQSESSGIGFTAGGAQDIENFRKNVENDFLPLHTDLTYEGLFSDYYFDTGAEQQCEKLFCPSYSYAISQDPLSEKDEYYLSVGLNSGIKESDFERKKLNLVVVLDVSGSMQSAFDRYYYDQLGNRLERSDEPENDFSKAKISIAAESIAGMIDHLKDGDRLGVVLFDNAAHVAKPLESMEATDRERLKKNILAIHAQGGTNMEAGIRSGTSLLEAVQDADPDEYENRIIFLTDAMPNTDLVNEFGLFGMIEKNARKGIHTTVIGIGVDFNTELVEHITKVSGANYYSIHSSSSFLDRMTDEFEFMVTPLVFDLVLRLESDGYSIEQVYGSPEADLATGEIMRINTLFPSKVKDGQTKGGIVLLKLEKASGDASITLDTSYRDRAGRTGGDSVTFELEDRGAVFYENTGIQKGILLAKYAELIKTWAFEERASYAHSQGFEPAGYPFYEDGMPPFLSEGIRIPYHVGNVPLGQWERQSIPLSISGGYQTIMGQFGDHFEREMGSIGDPELERELEILRKLEGQPSG